MRKYLAKFLYVYAGKRYLLALLLVTFIISSLVDTVGIALIGPFLRLSLSPDAVKEIPFLSWVYQIINPENHANFVLIVGFLLIALFVLKGIFFLASRYFILRVSLNQKRNLQLRLIRSFTRSPYEKSLNFNSADQVSMVMVEATQFALACAIPFFELWSNLIIIIALLFLIAETDATLALTSLIVILPVVILFMFFSKKSKELGKISTISDRETLKAINHGLGGLKESKLFGCESFFEDQISLHTKVHVDANIISRTIQLAPRAVIEMFLMVLIISIVCVYQVFLQRNIEVLISSLTVFAFSAIRLIPAISGFLKVITSLQSSSFILDKFYKTLKDTNLNLKVQNTSSKSLEVRPLHSKLNNHNFHKKITLDCVSYHYPNSKSNAIENISINISKGKSVAIIGKSGAGKTTLVDVILGLLKPQSGDILIDGTSIYKDIRSWQNLIGYIPQSIFLMDDSIEKNIAFGTPDELIDPDKISRALEIAQLDYLVKELPEGVKTFIGDRGARLSGGQRQRIGIARALYHEKEILVLDEATSALDGDTERLISQAINSLAGEKTLIIIAHRMSTIEKCDVVYRMDKGKIVASGSYKDIVLKESI